MATKKFVGSMQQYRNKEGVLEMEKSKGLSKKIWKSYGFKVSGSTYLLCFKTDPSNPEKTVLLSDVSKVVPAACHGVSFPFEVHFKSKGSPWRLNANSNEERMSWMEAISPGSSSAVAHFHRSSNQSPPLPTHNGTHPPHYTHTEQATLTSSGAFQTRSASLGQDTLQHAKPNPYADVPSLLSPTKDLMNDQDDSFLERSLGTPTSHTPQEYLLPSESLKLRKKIHSPPRHSASEGEVMKPIPSPRPRITPRPVKPSPAPRSPVPPDDGYIKMMSSPARANRLLQATVSADELPQYLELVTDSDEDMVDEDNYVIPDTPPNKKTSSSLSPGGSSGGSGGSGDLVDTIAKHFNKEQIGMLIAMLQEVRVKPQTAEEEAKAWEVPRSPTSSTAYGAGEVEDSVTLRGTLTHALSYAPDLSERMLVTEEDSEEGYEIRPQWAKAVPSHGQAAVQSEQLDTLTNLQQEAMRLAKADIKDLSVLGHGQFGEVFKGVLCRGAESMPVAVKMTKKTISEYLQESFMKEMGIMSQMMHPNIVRLFGVVTEDVASPWIVLEFMEHGDLKSFLTKNQRTVQQLVKYMVDIAMGMHYISSRGLVHRDLAARNVLVGANEICKVADFGLLREIPRDLTVYTASHSIPCPIRWMPPESISDRRFSAASDVWSFGVLVWEMFNPTKLPFDKLDNMAVVSKVNEGLRLPIPRRAPSIVAKIMKACWHRNPNKRPSFLVISTLLSTRTTF